MLSFLFWLVVCLIGAPIFLASKKPNNFSVSRSITIFADANAIFPHVNNLHRWEAWSPWVKQDPNATISFDGPPEGVDASMTWAGNYKVGKGSMTITQSITNEMVRFRLDFVKPLKGTSRAEFEFVQEAEQTRVTWSMSGTNSFPAKIMNVFMDCEQVVGWQFEQGLESLKMIAERR